MPLNNETQPNNTRYEPPYSYNYLLSSMIHFFF